ncbi:MAG TPA: fatty acid desaturase [Acidimicrobiales bacterium]|jgi:fatty acid desaturase|nr:fatty acid desaturase [Acidimicrobiales bacterium]
MGPHNAAVAPDDVDQTAALAADAADDGFGDRLDGHPTDIPEVPMVVYRRTLLPPERVRELSRRRPWRVVADTALCWAIIVAAWLAAAAIGTWWAILLAVLVVGNRYYSLFIIGHDGMHRRLFADMGRNDLFTDVFVLAPILSITHLNNRNHMRHHQMLGSEADPDRHKHACFNKADLLGLIGYLTGGSLAVNVFHVFVGQRSSKGKAAPATAATAAPSGAGSKRERYRVRDLVVLVACQAVLITGLTLLFGWWGYLVMWWVPVFAFALMADNLRTFAEHSHAESDAAADRHRLITNTPSRIERCVLSPMNMNFHAAHHLWPSIPYYNLAIADAEMRTADGADAITWRGSYLAHVWRYAKALPLPECRQAHA